MKIFANRSLLNKNPYLKNISEMQSFDEELNNIENSIILSERKNEYIIPYQYGDGVYGKGEHVLRWGLGCIYNCIYCYSKLKNKSSNIYVFPDIDGIDTELKKLLKKGSVKLNAGENFDSFILENKIPFATELSHLASKYKGLFIEFRTKALVPDHFIENANKKDIIIAFSLSPENIREKYEKGTPSMERKLKNIRDLQDNGFNIAIRFEPIILTEDYKENYKNLISNIDQKLDVNKIHSFDISLMRLTKSGYKNIKKYREIYDNEWIFHEDDRKFRYFFTKRIRCYDFLIKELSKIYNKKIHIGTEPENFLKDYYSKYIKIR